MRQYQDDQTEVKNTAGTSSQYRLRLLIGYVLNLGRMSERHLSRLSTTGLRWIPHGNFCHSADSYQGYWCVPTPPSSLSCKAAGKTFISSSHTPLSDVLIRFEGVYHTPAYIVDHRGSNPPLHRSLRFEAPPSLTVEMQRSGYYDVCVESHEDEMI